MKILKSWLSDYINLNGLDDEELDRRITLSGIEVEGVDKAIDDRVIVAEIKQIRPHPNADRLRLVTVDIGEKELEVVCGASNIEVGQRVPLAQVGSVLPGNFEIKEALIRGVKSCGMLCAEDELGLGDNHDGILIQSSNAQIGSKINEILKCETIFDLKPTPNRGDCFSHLGIAREIAALTDQKVNKERTTISPAGSTNLEIEIKDKPDCASYYGAYLSGLSVKDSPPWLQKRLTAIGVKPINNIVDATNYLMYDLGQPLHAFDAKKVQNHQIIVRRAEAGEKITTLDGFERNLGFENLVIADRDKAIALAGIIGGQNSEITSETIEIILESANFSASVVRKSAKKLSISTEASYRFERGVDPLAVREALEKTAALIVELAGGQIIEIKEEIASQFREKNVEVPIEKINSLLGLDLSEGEIYQILSRFGFEINDGYARIPSWRRDVAIWPDLAEEVGRIYGLNSIPTANLPKVREADFSDYHKKEYLKDLLVESGFSEVATYSIISEEEAMLAKLEMPDLLEIANPVQPENKYMRNSLIPGLLKTIAKNPIFDPILIFEIGNVFGQDFELTNIALAASGKNAKEALTTVIEVIKNNLDIKREIEIKELAREELARYKIRKPLTYYVEINATDLINEANFGGKDLSLKITNNVIHYRSLSKFPALTRDLAFIIEDSVQTDLVENDIYSQSDLINRVELFDEFSSDKFGQNKKNIAFHLYLQHPDRTLTDSEADEIINKVINHIKIKYNAQLRES